MELCMPPAIYLIRCWWFLKKKRSMWVPTWPEGLKTPQKTSTSLTVTGSTANTINILQIDMAHVYILFFKDKSIKNGPMVIKMLSDTSTSSNMASTYARNLLQLPPKNILFFSLKSIQFWEQIFFLIKNAIKRLCLSLMHVSRDSKNSFQKIFFPLQNIKAHLITLL